MLDRYRDLMDGLLETPTLLREALGDPVAAEISPELRELLRELSARESVTLRRTKLVMRHEHVRFRAIEDEPEMRALAEDDDRGGESLLTDFTRDRGELVSLLMNLTLREWDHTIDHETHGEARFSDEIEEHLNWDEGIVDRITAAA